MEIIEREGSRLMLRLVRDVYLMKLMQIGKSLDAVSHRWSLLHAVKVDIAPLITDYEFIATREISIRMRQTGYETQMSGPPVKSSIRK